MKRTKDGQSVAKGAATISNILNASGFFSRTLFFRLNIKRGPTTPHRKLFTAYHSTTCCNTWTSLAQKSLKFHREKKNPVHVSCSMIKNIAYCSSTLCKADLF
jgi:hypothetical protein